MSQNIILIETSTALCSAALVENGQITAYRESSAPKAHASLTAVFIQEMLDERGLALSQCDAVCVSKGPGSYTGLRVGVSTAKGLCFGSKKPLLDTLVAQAQMADQAGHDVIPDQVNVIPDMIGDPKFIIPMIDARRMEVYSAVFAFNPELPSCHPEAKVIDKVAEANAKDPARYRQITETAPAIIDENSFAGYLDQGSCLFIGDGAGKCAAVIQHPNAHFCQCYPTAAAMLAPALEAYKEKRFEDVAYFEPFYLKEFVATVSKKKLW